jgi:hypothetical protein
MNAAIPGLMAAGQNFDRAAERMSRAVSAPGEGDDSVSLSDAAVGLLAAKDTYEVNLQTVKAGDQMLHKLLDLLG